MTESIPSLPAAVVFDFDGVIVDSEPLHLRAFNAVLEPFDLAFTEAEYLERFIGFDDRDAFRVRFEEAGRPLSAERLENLIARKAELFAVEAERSDLRPLPGVERLIDEIRGKGIPLALCSGALRSDIDPILRAVGLRDAFPVIVSAEDTPASKPDPAPYRLACRRIGLTPGPAVVAVEDTAAGVESARKAGLTALAVGPTPLPGAALTLPALTEANLSLLERLAARAATNR